MKKCTGCGKEFQDQAFFCDHCGMKLGIIPDPAAAAAEAEQVRLSYPAEHTSSGTGSKGDFATAPAGINVISIIGFVLSFLCIGFIWIPELSIIIFPLAIISLVLCTIVKALKYNNLFAKVGFIVGLVVSIISAIVFGIHFYDMFF